MFEVTWNLTRLVAGFRDRVNHGINVLEAHRAGCTASIDLASFDLATMTNCAAGQVARAEGTDYAHLVYQLAGLNYDEDRDLFASLGPVGTVVNDCGFTRGYGLSWEQCDEIWREELTKRRLQAMPLTVIAPEEMALAA